MEQSLAVDASKGSSSPVSEKSLKNLLVEADLRTYYSHQKPEEERMTARGPSISINKHMAKSANSFFKRSKDSISKTIEISEFTDDEPMTYGNNNRKDITLNISNKFPLAESARLIQSALPKNQSSSSETALIEFKNLQPPPQQQQLTLKQPHSKSMGRARNHSMNELSENGNLSNTAPEGFFPAQMGSSSRNILSRSMIRTSVRISSQSPNPR